MTTAAAESPRTGLAAEEARARLRRYGPNALPEKRPESLATRLAAQFRSPLIYILLFALAVDAGVWFAEGASGLPLESIAIALILALNAGHVLLFTVALAVSAVPEGLPAVLTPSGWRGARRSCGV